MNIFSFVRSTIVGLGVLVACRVTLAQPAPPPAETQPRTPAQMAVQGGDEADHAALRALAGQYEQIVNQGKPELLSPHLDPEFSGVMVTGDAVNSAASLPDYWARIQNLLGQGGTYQVKIHVAGPATIAGDLAVAHGTTDEVAVAGGKEYHFAGQWTAICRKHDGQWRLLRVHGSMDPLGNPFVQAKAHASVIFWGAVAGAAGLVVGFVARWALSCRKATTAAGA